MVTTNKNILIMACVSLFLAACTPSKMTQNAIPEQGLTLSQLYQQGLQQPIQKPAYHQVKLEASTEEFKQLPNPEVPIHVFAHVAQLNDEQIIKPSYTTRFFLYKQNQYALSSELY